MTSRHTHTPAMNSISSFIRKITSLLVHLFPWQNASEIRLARSLSKAKSKRIESQAGLSRWSERTAVLPRKQINSRSSFTLPSFQYRYFLNDKPTSAFHNFSKLKNKFYLKRREDSALSSDNNDKRKSFTLIELLIVIAILVILAVVVILTLNPSELMAQGRDSTRLSDMASLNSAINIYLTDSGGTGSLGNANTLYVSIPDNSSSTCGDLGLPSLPTGWSYNCVSSTSSRNTDGTGWLPINLASTSSGTPLGSLPLDPVNSSSSGYYYTYATDGSTGGYELTMVPESQKYTSTAANDGGLDPASYETGSKLTLTPFAHGLVGYWPMNEGNGTIVYDKSGFGNNGNFTLGISTGTYPLWLNSNCINSSCLQFGNTSYISMIGNNTKSPTNAISFTVWADNLVSANGWQAYFSIGGGCQNSWYGLMIAGYGTIPYPVVCNYNNILQSRHSSVSQTNPGWHFIAYTYSSQSQNINVYVDGKLSNDGYSGTSPLPGPLQSNNTTLSYINSAWNYSSNQQLIMNNIREYNYALTLAQIQAIYNAKQ